MVRGSCIRQLHKQKVYVLCTELSEDNVYVLCLSTKALE